MKYLLPFLFVCAPAYAGMSGTSDCQECQKADNSVQMLCTLETKDVRGPVDDEDRERAEQLRGRHQAALSEGLIAQQNGSMRTRHGGVGVAAAGKASASKDSASACREARQKAERKCQNKCTCSNCERAGQQADQWDAQAAEDLNFSQQSFAIQDQSDAGWRAAGHDQQPSAERRQYLRQYNSTPPGFLYPQQPAR